MTTFLKLAGSPLLAAQMVTEIEKKNLAEK